VPFIVNDDLELALAVRADGVHLGRDDGDVAAARARLPGRLLGYGTLFVGALEVGYVPQARRVAQLVERLCG